MSVESAHSPALFAHPFSKAYWKQAFSEFRNTRVLIFAALMVALRVIFKAVSIPIGMDLRINTAFLINAFGAMVFGPVVAAAAAAVTDTLGCLLFPTGTYFFPFILIEISGSVIFALFLYRTHITPMRVILSRFCIDFFVNIVLNTPIMMLYYQIIMGKYYAPFDMIRIVKNLVMFPIESVILILFLNLTVPRIRSLGFVVGDVQSLKITRKTAALLVVLFLVGSISVGGYSFYAYEHTSLSASYSSSERMEMNKAITEEINSREPSSDTRVAIIESAFPSLFTGKITYTAAVYTVDQEKIAARSDGGSLDDAMQSIYAYSKTPASKDDALTRRGTAVIVFSKDQQVLEYSGLAQ